MNKDRRTEIESITKAIDSLKGRVEIVRDEEQEYFDNMPESFQSAEKGMGAEAAVEALDDALGDLDSAIAYLNAACGD